MSYTRDRFTGSADNIVLSGSSMMLSPDPWGNPSAKSHIGAIKMWKTCPGSPNTRTRAHGEAHIKEAAFGRPPCGFLYFGPLIGNGLGIWGAWAGLSPFYFRLVGFWLLVSPWGLALTHLNSHPD